MTATVTSIDITPNIWPTTSLVVFLRLPSITWLTSVTTHLSSIAMRPILRMLAAALLTLLISASDGAELGSFEVLHEWQHLDFDWPSADKRAAALESSAYVPDYCILADVKAVDGVVFVTVPRWRHGVPSSVNQLVTVSGNTTVLRPYPSWDMNAPAVKAASDGSCKSIQYAHVIEIDPKKRMWIVDNGRRAMFTRPNNECPPKLIIWDMVENKEVRRHVFPEEVVDKSNALLRGIVVDTSSPDPDDWFAYIASSQAGRLVVYSYREDSSWFVHHPSMEYDANAVGVSVSGHSAAMPVPIDSLALSPRTSTVQRLYYAPVSSFMLYSMPTSLLRNGTIAESLTEAQLDEAILDIGARSSQSEGMTVSSTGVMYYSVLNNNAINQYNTSRPYSALDQVYKDDEKLQWVDSFGWDAGYLYFTSNRMQKTATLDFDANDEILYRLMRAKIGTAGYMGPYEEGKKISVAGAASIPLVSLGALAAVLCVTFASLH